MADSAPLLSQDEIAALTEGVKNGSIEVDSGFNTEANVKKHDLASEDSSLGVNVALRAMYTYLSIAAAMRNPPWCR